MMDLRESSTYQAILREGEALGQAKRLIRMFGTKRFGCPPDLESLAVLENMMYIERVEELADRLFDVDSWRALLASGHPADTFIEVHAPRPKASDE